MSLINLYLVSSILAIFLGILAVSKKKPVISNTILSLLLFSFGVKLLLNYFTYDTQIFNFFVFLRLIIPLLFAPLVYLYVGFLTRIKTKLTYSDIIHILPFGIIFLSGIIFIGLTNRNHLLTELIKQTEYILGKYLIISSAIIYIFFSIRTLYAYKKTFTNKYSFSEKVNLRWLNNLLGSFIFSWFIIWSFYGINRKLNLMSQNEESLIIYLIMSGFVVFLGFWGIRQTNIFSNYDYQINPEKENFAKQNKITNNKPDHKKELFKKIEEIVISEKLYLEPRLTIDDLAKKLSSNAKYISEAINNEGGFSFYEYINRKRVEEFKKLSINNPNNDTISIIAYQAGFNSKSSFNRIFKEITGQTPSEYLKTIN